MAEDETENPSEEPESPHPSKRSKNASEHLQTEDQELVDSEPTSKSKVHMICLLLLYLRLNCFQAASATAASVDEPPADELQAADQLETAALAAGEKQMDLTPAAVY